MEGSEIAHPGRARREGRQRQEEPRSAGQGQGIAPLAGEPDEGGEHQHDDDGSHERCQIGVDALDAYLGEDGSEGGEYCR